MPPRTLACLNGDILPAEEAKVPIWDRGFLFGDSVYEVFRLYDGRCWLEQAHLKRLERSLNEVEIGGVDLDRLMDRVRRTIEASEVKEGTAYIQVTRGVAPRKHTFPEPAVEPTEVIVIRHYDDSGMVEARRKGVGVLTQPDLRWKRCDIKSTNLLGNVLALQAAHRQGCQEAVLIDDRGRVTESTHSSLLWVRAGRLEGTPDGFEILPGTTRHLVLELAEAAGTTFHEALIDREELLNAQEVILFGTTIEVLPVVRVDDRAIGDGTPGPVTRRLQDAFNRSLAAWKTGAPVSEPVAGR